MIDINTEGRGDSYTIKTKIIAKLARLTAKIILKYNAHYQEFFELFKRELIKKVENKTPGPQWLNSPAVLVLTVDI